MKRPFLRNIFEEIFLKNETLYKNDFLFYILFFYEKSFFLAVLYSERFSVFRDSNGPVIQK